MLLFTISAERLSLAIAKTFFVLPYIVMVYKYIMQYTQYRKKNAVWLSTIEHAPLYAEYSRRKKKYKDPLKSNYFASKTPTQFISFQQSKILKEFLLQQWFKHINTHVALTFCAQKVGCVVVADGIQYICISAAVPANIIAFFIYSFSEYISYNIYI